MCLRITPVWPRGVWPWRVVKKGSPEEVVSV